MDNNSLKKHAASPNSRPDQNQTQRMPLATESINSYALEKKRAASPEKKITVFCGHYGSGKTNIAVNYALWLKKDKEKVSIADLDIVNPYFRTKDSMNILEERGIRLISSEYANSNVDVPALPGDVYSVLDDKDVFGVIDVGGDDRGALALGRYSDGIISSGSFEVLMVVNMYRPLTRSVEETLEVMAEIENACHMKITGIINNSNIGEETTADDVLKTTKYAEEIALKSGVPVRFTAVKEELYDELQNKIDNLMPLVLYVRQSWAERNE